MPEHLAELHEQRAKFLQRQAQALTARSIGFAWACGHERP